MLQFELGGKFHCARLAQVAVKFSGSKTARTYYVVSGADLRCAARLRH